MPDPMSWRSHVRLKHATTSVLFVGLRMDGQGNLKTAGTFEHESNRPPYSLLPLGQGAAADIIHIPGGKTGQERIQSYLV